MGKKDFTKTSYGDGFGSNIRLDLGQESRDRAGILRARRRKGSPLLGGRSSRENRSSAEAMVKHFRDSSPRTSFCNSYLAGGAGMKAEAARSVERAAAIPVPLDLYARRDLADGRCSHGVVSPGPHGRAGPVGRAPRPARARIPGHRAGSSCRRSRGYVDVSLTLGFFGPVPGHLPEFRSLREDLEFPADPFVPERGSEDDETAADRRGPQP